MSATSFALAIEDSLNYEGDPVIFIIKQRRPEGVETVEYHMAQVFPQDMCHIVDEYANIDGENVRIGSHHEPNSVLPYCFGENRTHDRIDLNKQPTGKIGDRWLEMVVVG